MSRESWWHELWRPIFYVREGILWRCSQIWIFINTSQWFWRHYEFTSWTSQVNQTLLTLVLSSSGRMNISSFLRLEPRHRPLAWDDSGALKKKLMSYWSLIQFLYDFCNKIDKHPINNCKRENIYIYIYFFFRQTKQSLVYFIYVPRLPATVHLSNFKPRWLFKWNLLSSKP
jgi:hypothetical protein